MRQGTVKFTNGELHITFRVFLPEKISSRIVVGQGQLAITINITSRLAFSNDKTTTLIEMAAQYSEQAEKLKQMIAKKVDELVERFRSAAEACSGKRVIVEGWRLIRGDEELDCIPVRKVDDKDWAFLKRVTTRMAIEALAEATTDLRKELLRKQLELLEALRRIDEELAIVVGLDVAAKLALAERVEQRLAVQLSDAPDASKCC